MRIAVDDPLRPDVLALLRDHVADMRATSPPESVHTLEPAALVDPAVTFWSLRDDDDGALLGCAALKRLGPASAEIKSMRTAPAARRRGVAARLLDHLLVAAAEAGLQRLWLETGVEDFFAPARALYASRGFTTCEPFGDYRPDPHSVFMTRGVTTGPTGPTGAQP